MSLLEAPKNQSVVVQEIEGTCKQRLMNLGIFKGTKLVVMGSAPLGDPLIVEVSDFKIAIRKADARNIIVA